ncbi:phosphoribosyltransferase family protein [Robiginitalea sp. M366]|uniref:phosphoribosyltransferase family protein n=1 Tax=Robiginitalea aestuariiviva TaxID=3036903 RepID=UPI00240D73BA|nr:phosphoribosyltransferase family protein [Robiginitalea aestuariiviva]MDG1572517.1 phosphoribosyltransferase family protein [Robiginitalea aestuariiviva]
MENRILTHQQIQYKIRRMAYQIYESNVEEPVIVLAGIRGGGLELTKKIKAALEQITDADILLCQVEMDKKDPLTSGVTTSLKPEQYAGQSVVIIDDVLNSGSTLIYAVHHFLKTPTKQIKTAVLVNRNHKRYPVKADFKGVSLSTSLHEHVRVDFAPRNHGVYLD